MYVCQELSRCCEIEMLENPISRSGHRNEQRENKSKEKKNMFQIIGVPVTTSEIGKYVLIRSSAGLLAPETYNISTPISRVNTAFFVSLNLPCWNLPSKYLNFMHKVDFFCQKKQN